MVKKWDVGIKAEGDYALIALFKSLGGSLFQHDDGNATAGLLFEGAKNGVAGSLHASFNGVAGIIVRNSPGVRVFNFSATNNQQSGVWLDHSDDGTIATASASNNEGYGIWLFGSSRNTITDCNGTTKNGTTGILLGCGTTKCAGHDTSDQNRITNSGAPSNLSTGIVIEHKSDNNIVTVTHNDGNPEGDMVDLNNKCGTNIWYNNTGTGNQSCIR